jgi:hypothetical protein
METYSEMMKGIIPCRIANQTTTTSNNRRTNEEEALTEPINNVCSFNDDEIALQKQTMPIQLVVDNNIVQNHCNIVWKILTKNVL